MSQESIRLKIEIDSSDLELFKNLETKFWYFLDRSRLKTIGALKRDLMVRLFYIKAFHDNRYNTKKTNYSQKFSSVHLSLDRFELPLNESTSLLRDLDKINLHLAKQRVYAKIGYNQHQDDQSKHIYELNDKKRKKNEPLISNSKKACNNENWDSSPMAPAALEQYEVCLIGTSMIKHINVKDLFSEKRCFFKSINGGFIKSITQCLEARELLLKKCKLFIITAGSNDIDSTSDVYTAINDFISLMKYLKKCYPDAKFIINELIPRVKTKNVEISIFEERRIVFNEFLTNDLDFLDEYAIVKHEAFNNTDKLGELLSDGVHMSTVHGVPIYVSDIRKSIE